MHTTCHRLPALACRWVLLTVMALLAACSSLPPRGTVPPSQAYAYSDVQGTPLARIAAASRPQGESAEAAAAAPSGFRLLPTGEFAFGARSALARRAQRSLDLQYYHIQRDQAGQALLRELRDAAQRGVRVRLLVDDFYAAEIGDLLADMATMPNLQVRLFNPLPLRHGAPVLRLMLSAGDFELHNHRMHNKLFVADNAVALYGGRNVADEYFMSNAQANFIDMDVLSTGAVVRDLSAAFDSYWNSTLAWPVQAVLGTPGDSAAALAHFDAEVRDAKPPTADYRLDPMGQTTVEAQLDQGRLALVHASATVHPDPPDKATEQAILNQPTAAMQGMLDAMATARSEVNIVSPYFVPTEVGMKMMRLGAEHKVHTRLFTNSIGSTDEPLVHDYYSRYRVDMLKLGVEIYEFSPVLTRRSRGFGFFGSSTPRLHAKVTMVDRQRLLVGSVNLDGRSAIGNTEMSVVINSPALADAAIKLMMGDRFTSMYRLRLQPDGQTIEWVSTDADGRETAVTTDEPESSWWLRFKLKLQSLFVDERFL